MPDYARRCPACEHRFSDFAKASDVEHRDVGDVLPCPECGTKSEPDFSQTRVARGFRVFTGEEGTSLTEGCHPREVPEMKKLMGPDLEGCIGADGRMRFSDSKQRREWDKRMDSLAERRKAKLIEKKETKRALVQSRREQIGQNPA